MRVLFVITSSDTGAWLSEITHPYWHLAERGIEVDFASPKGGKIVWSPFSDPYFNPRRPKTSSAKASCRTRCLLRS
jgi:putative intracellular protease/amidase